jgi:hypothetical protein
MPDPIYCDSLSTEDIGEMAAKLPGETICNFENLPEVTIYTCNAPADGGYGCTEKSPIIADIDPEVVATAWTVFTTEEDVAMVMPLVFGPYGPPLDWKCYNWVDATNEFAELPYVFQMYDLACDVGIVFECINPASCNTVQPSLDLEADIWYPLPFKANTQQPTFVPQMDCTEYYVDFPYLEGDNVCNEYGDLFTCMLPVQCSFVKPNYFGFIVWKLIEPVYATYVEDIEPETVECLTYDGILNGADKGDFAIGDIVCEAERAWSCINIKNCNNYSPMFANDNDKLAWELLQVYADVDTSFEDTMMASVEISTLPDCVNEGSISSVAPQVDSNDIWDDDVTYDEYTVVAGIVCATTAPEQAVVRSTLFLNEFNYLEDVSEL